MPPGDRYAQAFTVEPGPRWGLARSTTAKRAHPLGTLHSTNRTTKITAGRPIRHLAGVIDSPIWGYGFAPTLRPAWRGVGAPPSANAFIAEPMQCWRMIHDRQGQATHCYEPPSWTGRWFSPSGDRWWRVWAYPEHLEGLTGLRQFGG